MPDTDVRFFGNFNCVQSSHLDRLGGLWSGRPGIPALTTLLNTLDLEDAATLAGESMDDEVVESMEYYTYWNARPDSRIDRFYTHKTWTATVRQVQIRLHVLPSDHQQVTLHVADNG